MSINYKNSLVCFIDLLGFKDEINSRKSQLEIFDILSAGKKNERSVSSTVVKKTGQEIRFQVLTAVSAFSDRVVISFSSDYFDSSISSDWIKSAFIKFWNLIYQYSMYVMRRGFILRGGIAIGNLYHSNGIVFGPAMNCAYELESKRAKNPRILVNEKLAQVLNDDTKQRYLSKDLSDGFFYVDFLKHLVDENINPATNDYCSNSELIAKLITKNILFFSQKIEDENKLKKWKWFSNYYHDSCVNAGFDCRCELMSGKYDI